jgi:hypothetical protein
MEGPLHCALHRVFRNTFSEEKMEDWKEDLKKGLARQMLGADSAIQRRAEKMGTVHRMFKTISKSTVPEGEDLDIAQRIVEAYTEFLAIAEPFPGCIADARQLPHFKDAIKDALIVCIRASEDPDLQAVLKRYYLKLCVWQDGVGEHPIGVDFTRIDLEAEPMKIAKLVQQKALEIEKWRPLIEAEQGVLGRELSELRL